MNPEYLLTAMSVDMSALIIKMQTDPVASQSLVEELKKTSINAMPEGLIDTLLEKLNVPTAQRGRFQGASISVYNLIMELNALIKPPTELNTFVDELNKTTSIKWRRRFFIGVLFTAGIFPLVYAQDFSSIMRLMAGVAVIPVVSLAYTLGVMLQTLYPFLPRSEADFQNKTSSFWNRFKHNFFALSGSLIYAVTYALVIAAAATGPVIASLYVVGSFAHVIQEIWALSSHRESKEMLAPVEGTPLNQLHAQQRHARYETEHNQRKREIMINLTVSVLLALLVVAWCFVPGGIFVAVAVIAAMGVVYLAQRQALQKNKDFSKIQLEKEFRTLETEYSLDAEYANDSVPVHGSTKIINEKTAICSPKIIFSAEKNNQVVVSEHNTKESRENKRIEDVVFLSNKPGN